MKLPLEPMDGMPTNLLDQTGLRVARCDFDGTVNADAIMNAVDIRLAVNEHATLLTENAALKREVERLRGELANVVIHTAHLPGAKYELLEGLLASCERIAKAALSTHPLNTKG